MKAQGTKNIVTLSVSLLILTSLFVIVGNSTNYAEATEQAPINLATSSAPSSTSSGEVIAASGSNRFAAWYDYTPGNPDIMFKRSTDNGLTWQPTVNLSNNPGDSTDPQVAVSGSNIFVVWRQASAVDSSVDIFFRGSTDNGVTWGAKIKISSSGAEKNELPQLTASGSNVYVVWDDQVNIFFRSSTNNGISWNAIVTLTDAGFSIGAQIAVSGSNVYVVWHAFSTNFEIIFRRSTDNGETWKELVNVSRTRHSSDGQQIAVSGSNVYVVWHDFTSDGTDVLLRRSIDGGATWETRKNLSNAGEATFNPQIAVSGSNVFVVLEDQVAGEILLRRSTDSGATWKPEKNLSNNIESSIIPQIAVSGSNVFVVWQDHTPGNNDIMSRRSNDNGATWKAVKNLSNNAGSSVSPQIAVSGSNVFVVWQDDTPGNNDIMSRRSTDSGATWKAVKNLSNNAGNSFLPQIAV